MTKLEQLRALLKAANAAPLDQMLMAQNDLFQALHRHGEALLDVVEAAVELERFLTHDIGMDKLELTNLRQRIAKLEAPT